MYIQHFAYSLIFYYIWVNCNSVHYFIHLCFLLCQTKTSKIAFQITSRQVRRNIHGNFQIKSALLSPIQTGELGTQSQPLTNKTITTTGKGKGWVKTLKYSDDLNINFFFLIRPLFHWNFCFLDLLSCLLCLCFCGRMWAWRSLLCHLADVTLHKF